MTIYLDMDGTIANLYGVENWLEYLINEDTFPYKAAEPLIDMAYFNELCIQLQNKGIKIGIISWLSRGGSKEYNKEVRKVKKEWLARNVGIKFDEVHIVKYGTKKNYVANDKLGILFDDEIQNRENWKGNSYNEKEIFEILEELLR